MPLNIVNADITTLPVDAIVNAANEQLLMGGGVCGAIFRAAGPHELQAACNSVGHCATGSAVVTPGFKLPAKYVIHTVGPIWHGGDRGERELLASCYAASLRLARDLGCTSAAFPLISSGIYGYPRAEAYEVARDTIEKFLADDRGNAKKATDEGADDKDAGAANRTSSGEMTVYLALLGTRRLMRPQERRSLDAYIDHQLARSRYLAESGYDAAAQRVEELNRAEAEDYLDGAASGPAPSASRGGTRRSRAAKRKRTESWDATGRASAATPAPSAAPAATPQPAATPHTTAPRPATARPAAGRPKSLAQLLDEVDAPFGETLMRMIDERGLTDVEVYHRANMSRQHFAKLRAGGRPSKRTVLALCVALGLSVGDSELLLQRAGFALNPSDKADIIVAYYLERGGATVVDVNLALYEYDQPLLTK